MNSISHIEYRKTSSTVQYVYLSS